MKHFIRSLMITALLFSVIVSITGLTGCASNKDNVSKDNITMHDFIGGGKPELGGRKY